MVLGHGFGDSADLGLGGNCHSFFGHNVSRFSIARQVIPG